MITEFVLGLWLICAIYIVITRKIYRAVICFGVFSLCGSLAYLFLGSPDVAMAEAAIAAFTTIFFIICVEKFYGYGTGLKEEQQPPKTRFIVRFWGVLLPFVFTAGLLGLFVYFIPSAEVSTYLRDLYLHRFWLDVGGENAVTAIYLGYRVYDTLFEALLLVLAVVAVAHMSWFDGTEAKSGEASAIKNSNTAKFTMRIICPIIIMFGLYLIANGHISAGGGFQGGLAVATFFICRYLVYDIYDIPVKKVMRLEELIFINIAILPALAIFTGVTYVFEVFFVIPQTIYLTLMNVMIGFKVACGFFILFYRYIAIENSVLDDKGD